MGVQGLWDLLAPVGRRVSVETLAGKKLAIDASIWMVQFTKAMRDEKGEMVRNAHLVGFFRRICKLLFLRTRPVFVFDGGTPALKRRTVAARRRHRENARAKIRKTAEKLLINHLKSRRLEELADEIKRVNEQKDDPKGKRVVAEDAQILKASSADKQKVLDELLAASLAAEEEGGLMFGDASSAADVVEEGAEDDDNEELMFPVIHGNIDPNVLASLPPSIQLDLLVQMRERQMAENRQKYQKIKKVPTKFSELQIQSYLKTVAFRREIDEVQKVASGRGLGGVQASRIASEANREFIFSSSFSGNKQTLTSLAATRVSSEMQPGTLINESDGAGRSINSSIVQLSHVSQSAAKEPATNFDSDVETYRDERGRFRVSRNRALGIRMTRDLERNLELMKEHEKEHHTREGSADAARSCSGDFSVNITGADPSSVQSPYISGNDSAMEISFLDDGQDDMGDRLFSHLVAGSPMSGFSLENTWFGKCSKDVLCEEGIGAEKKDQVNTSDHTKIHLSCAEEDVDWEEGINIEKKDQVNTSNHMTIHLSSDEEVVDWEDGTFRSFQMVSQEKTQNESTLPKGLLEEQAEIQEAIRRSLEDVRHRHLEDPIYQSPAMKNNGSSNVFSPQMGTVERDQLDQAIREDALQEDADVGEDLKSSKQFVSPVAGIKENQDALESRDTSSNLESFGYLGDRDNISNQSIEVPNKTFVDDSQLRQSFRNCHKELAEASSRAYADSTCKLQNIDNIDGCLGNQNDMFMKEGIYQNISTNAHKMTGTFQSPIGITNQDEIITEDLQIAKDKAVCVETRKENPQSNFEVDQLESLMEDAQLPFLDEEISRLRLERENLGDEQRRHEINSDTVSSEMFAECQELLQMFGLPYIIAPMEAEAQCAHMELVNLVDGVVTDDSDVFLFGARSVYKNIFDDRKYVETYFMKDMETELGLTREKLICMALLLGSDYTEGVSGIGIVNAIEVVNAFPEEDGLQKFRDWLESPDPDILEKVGPQTGVNSKKKSKVANSCENKLEKKLETNANNFDGASLPIAEGLSESKKIFMSKHRNVSKNWHVPSSFPSLSVISAYSSPQVDESTESFSWGKPDLLLLRKLCWERFGWSNQKADELLLPVLKEYNKHETQLRLEAFYSFNERFAKIRSQRIKKAVKGITGRLSAGLLGEPAQDSSNSQEKASSLLKPTAVGGQSECTRTDTESERSDLQTKHLVKGNIEGCGRGARGRGRGERKVTGNRNGRGRAGGRRAKPNNNPLESDLSNRDDDIGENQDKVSQVAPELRMSARQRKTVKYTEESSEDDDVSTGLDTSESKAVDQAAKIIGADIETMDTLGIPDQTSMATGGHLDDRMPKEYLFSGGGFCADEDGANPANGLKEATPASLPASIGSDADFVAGMEGYSGSQFKENSEEPSQMDDQGLASSMGAMHSGLRAMPMLRRKRRKTQ